MPQAGIHSMVGMAVRKWTPKAEWLMLGIVLGNLFPDTDNLVVAIATLAKLPTEGIHRTFTHSLFTVVVILAIFYLTAALSKKRRWLNFGIGMGVGVLMHILLDLLLWFNGVAILWPIPSWIDLWSWYTPPVWLSNLLLTGEYLFFALYFLLLASLARRQKTDAGFHLTLRIWTILQFILFAVLTVLVFVMSKGFTTLNGLVYLLSLALAIGVTIRMRGTIGFSTT
jgi:membrane-bound metal-dependent hydrolase YbcI (DUF457 family)